MKFAICNETFGDWKLADALTFARSTGYTGWEVAPFMLSDDIQSFGANERHQYRSEVEAAGLEIIGLHWLLAKTEGLHLTASDSGVRKATADYLIALGEACADLGGDLHRAHHRRIRAL